jgi:2-keto-4-pentenoate hydratase
MSKVEALAERIVEARRQRRFATVDPALACASAAEAYAVQAAVARKLGTLIAGWKVGLFEDGRGWGAPIFACDMVAAGGTFNLSGDLSSVKVEAELALRLDRDLPLRPGQPYSRDELLAACSEVLTGIELVGTRFSDPENLNFESRLADNFANTAYAAGPGTRTFADLDLPTLRCRLDQDGKSYSDRKGGHQAGDPLIPALAFINTQGDALGGPRAGQFITTGTLTDPYDLAVSAQLDASIEHIGTVRVFTKIV